jgi:hypothetical protein
LDLFTKGEALDGFNPFSTSKILCKRLPPRLKRDTVLKELYAALEETPPPSLWTVAEGLGYKQTVSLRNVNAQLCDQLVANFNQHTLGKEKAIFKAQIQDDEVIKSALESALKENSPPSLGQIARRLGYTASQALRRRFPILCKVLADKKRTLESHRREQAEVELEQALSSDPPISLDAIVKKLGYRTDAVLRTKYPELCRRIRECYAKYNQMQFMLRVKHELELALIESPPPTVKVVFVRIGVSDRFLYTHFPKEHKLISKRYLEHRKNQSELNKEKDKMKIRNIIQELIKQKKFPSMNAVMDIYTASYLKRPEVWSTILQARQEFGFPI